MQGTSERRGAAALLRGILRDLDEAPHVSGAGGRSYIGAATTAALIRRGSQGTGVVAVQRMINVWNARRASSVTPLAEDGAFGPATEAAIRLFQRSTRLTADGIVGPLTWQGLMDTVVLPAESAVVSGEPQDLVFGLDLLDLMCGLVDIPHAADVAILPLWNSIVLSNVAIATAIPISAYFKDRLRAYARSNLSDGAILMAGYTRCPRFVSGGWIMDLQPGAAAMTLDKTIFVNGTLDIDTYVHETVHVGQYKLLGITGFLLSYFGLSAATILGRWIRRVPIDPMRSSPHENQAYEIEGRFKTWHASNP